MPIPFSNELLGAIQDRDFTLFNYLTHQLVEDRFEDRPWLVKELHYPDLNGPGLTPADITALPKFVKPKTKAEVSTGGGSRNNS